MARLPLCDACDSSLARNERIVCGWCHYTEIFRIAIDLHSISMKMRQYKVPGPGGYTLQHIDQWANQLDEIRARLTPPSA